MLIFKKGEKVLSKVLPTKGVMHFGKNNELRLRYIRPFEVFKGVGLVSYELYFPPSKSKVYLIFYVSMLKKYHCSDPPGHFLHFCTISPFRAFP